MSDKKHHPLTPVFPGPCPIIDGVPICPPPIEIDVIKVKKIFQECKHTQVEEVDIPFVLTPSRTNSNNNLVAQCVSAIAENVSCDTLSPGVVKIKFDLTVCSRLVDSEGKQVGDDECKTVEGLQKVLTISRAGEPGLNCQGHVYPECLLCFVSDSSAVATNNTVTVTCCIGILILIKLEAEVQLLVPCYGYAPEPPECDQVLGECPDEYQPVWPPYPPQDRPPIGSNPSTSNTGKPGKPGCGRR